MERTAVLLAGGKSSRMGRDKALLPFGGFDSLAEYQYRRLLAWFEQVYLASKSDKFDFSAQVIEDRYPTASPLVALVSIFETLPIEELFVLSVDAPFVDEAVIARLYAEADTHADVVVATSPLGIEPLCGIYRRTILPQAKQLLAEDNHRLRPLLNQLQTQRVYFEEGDAFVNLNHPHEYHAAYRLSSSI